MAAARGRRLELGQTQAEVATRARVSRQWVNEFEAGKATAELGLVLRLLDALDLGLHLGANDVRPASGTDTTQDRDAAVDLDALLGEYRTS